MANIPMHRACLAAPPVAVHTGSVNDHAAYAVAGLLALLDVLILT